ncbi:MAG TPA: hypothetical protein VLX92_05040 [Kofleriaceae bacterium]|nr:hypothetical protein [Kofleriaceae bacterium]
MTRALAAMVVAIAACSAGCSVDKRSDALACANNSDCMSPRTCQMGYCVIGSDCPSQCTSCNLEASPPSCTLIGGTGGSTFECPSGMACTVDCTGNSACGSIHCQDAASCSVICTGDSACGNITCGQNGSGSCSVMCIGNSACGNVTCDNACGCDVQCDVSSACGSLSCPQTQDGSDCTTTGNSGDPCISSLPGCSC